MKMVAEKFVVRGHRRKERIWPITADGGQEAQVSDAEVLGLVHNNAIKGGRFTLRDGDCQFVNMAEFVIILRELSAERIRSNIDHNTTRLRLGKPRLAAQSGDIAVRFPCVQLHASTTCCHSVRRKCGLNLCGPASFDAVASKSTMTSRGAIFG